MGVMTGFSGHLIWMEGVSGKACKEGLLGGVRNISSIIWNGLHSMGFVDLKETEDSGLCLEKCAYT